MDKPLVYLDVDDCTNDFALTAMRAVGCAAYSHQDYPREHGWDIVGAARSLGWRGNARDFWGPNGIGYRGFYQNVRRSDELEQLERVLERADVYLISACNAQSADCVAGKLDWIANNLPPEWAKKLICTDHKHLLATASALLIDDAQHNCDAWEKHGGKVALMPRPWNNAAEHQYPPEGSHPFLSDPMQLNFWAVVHEHINSFYDPNDPHD